MRPRGSERGACASYLQAAVEYGGRAVVGSEQVVPAHEFADGVVGEFRRRPAHLGGARERSRGRGEWDMIV